MVKAGKQSVINAAAKPSLASFADEVVVTAMGSKGKEKLNYGTNIDSKEVMEESAKPLWAQMQGKISGLSVSSTGGSPNASSDYQPQEFLHKSQSIKMNLVGYRYCSLAAVLCLS